MNKMTPAALTFQEIRALGNELRPLIARTIVVDCAAMDASRFLLVLQKDAVRKRLFFCFQKPFICLYLAQPLEGFKPSLSPHPLKSLLLNATLHSIEVLNEDRILAFSFYLDGRLLQLVAELFPKHPNIYLIDQHQQILFSLYPSKGAAYTLPTAQAPPNIAHESMRSNQAIEKQFMESLFGKEKGLLEHRLKQQHARHYKLIQKWQNDLIHAQGWESLQHEGELLKANFGLLKRGTREIHVWDWMKEQEVALSLDPRLSPQEIVASRFKQSKKMLKSIPHVQDQLSKAQQALAKIEADLASLEGIASFTELEAFRQHHFPELSLSKQKKEAMSARPYYEYESATGIKIWVGKNAKNNDVLTFQLARGLDWWLHVKDMPGSHVIIRTSKGQEPDQETLQDALQLALHYSKAKNEGQGEVCLTQRKFVSRLNIHQPGRVQISKHKTLFIRLDAPRLKHLQERKHQS